MEEKNMVTVFSAKLDGSESVRHHYVSLVMFYLTQSSLHANAAQSADKMEVKFKESLLAILFSTLCIEAFANEVAEHIMEQPELKEFLSLRKKYKKPKEIGEVRWKIMCLFEREWPNSFHGTDTLFADVAALFQLRNDLVHYKVSPTAEKCSILLRKRSSALMGCIRPHLIL